MAAGFINNVIPDYGIHCIIGDPVSVFSNTLPDMMNNIILNKPVCRLCCCMTPHNYPSILLIFHLKIRHANIVSCPINQTNPVWPHRCLNWAVSCIRIRIRKNINLSAAPIPFIIVSEHLPGTLLKTPVNITISPDKKYIIWFIGKISSPFICIIIWPAGDSIRTHYYRIIPWTVCTVSDITWWIAWRINW